MAVLRPLLSAVNSDGNHTDHTGENSFPQPRSGQIRVICGSKTWMFLGRAIYVLGQLQISMLARSKQQQMAAGAALAAKRGERKKSSLKGASKKMAESMSKEQLSDFVNTKRKKLPTKKRKFVRRDQFPLLTRRGLAIYSGA
jgi:Protein of unknwon function (DUF3008)